MFGNLIHTKADPDASPEKLAALIAPPEKEIWQRLKQIGGILVLITAVNVPLHFLFLSLVDATRTDQPILHLTAHLYVTITSALIILLIVYTVKSKKLLLWLKQSGTCTLDRLRLVEEEVRVGREQNALLEKQVSTGKKELHCVIDNLLVVAEQLRNVSEIAGELLWTEDEKGNLSYLSSSIRQLTGYHFHECLGYPFINLIQEDQRQAFSEFIKQVLRHSKVIPNFETQLARKDGTSVEVAVNAISLRDEKSRVIGLTGTLSLVTRYKKVERALRANQHLLFNDDAITDNSAFLNVTVAVDELLNAQLQGVIDETEKAAFQITEYAKGLDGQMTALLDFMSLANAQFSDMGQNSQKIIMEDKNSIDMLQQFIADADTRREEGHNKVTRAMEEVQNLRRLVQIVMEIGERTNILALNANIVAARAGEHGHKFAIVAQEVRKLSEQSRNAAKQIDSGIAQAVVTVEAVLLDRSNDSKDQDEDSMLKEAAKRMERLGIHYGQLLEFNEATMRQVDASNNEMSSGIVALMMGIQFQDVTRQRIEHIIRTLTRRKEHVETLMERLRNPGADIPIKGMTVQDLFPDYVMAQQRDVHVRQIGDSSLQADSELLDDIELF